MSSIKKQPVVLFMFVLCLCRHGLEHLFMMLQICPRLLFFQMKTHFMSGHTRVVGNVVNVPIDVAPTVEKLPRSLSDTEMTVVKYKLKLEYKNV